MSDRPPFCINCRWCNSVQQVVPVRSSLGSGIEHYCTAPQLNGPVYDLVTGEELQRGIHRCAVQRQTHLGMCGPKGSLWEAKA